MNNAEQQSPRRRIALKVIRGGQVVDDQRVRMFTARAAPRRALRINATEALKDA